MIIKPHWFENSEKQFLTLKGFIHARQTSTEVQTKLDRFDSGTTCIILHLIISLYVNSHRNSLKYVLVFTWRIGSFRSKEWPVHEQVRGGITTVYVISWQTRSLNSRQGPSINTAQQQGTTPYAKSYFHSVPPRALIINITVYRTTPCQIHGTISLRQMAVVHLEFIPSMTPILAALHMVGLKLASTSQIFEIVDVDASSPRMAEFGSVCVCGWPSYSTSFNCNWKQEVTLSV